MSDLEAYLHLLDQSGYTRMPGGHLRNIKYYTNLSSMTYLYEDGSDGRIGILVTVSLAGEGKYLQLWFRDDGDFVSMTTGV